MSEDRTTILMQISVSFKEAIGEKAQAQNKSLSQFVREVMAREVGYDLSQDVKKLGRPRKSDAQKSQMALTKKLLEQFLHEEHEESVEALAEWLRKRGHTDV